MNNLNISASDSIITLHRKPDGKADLNRFKCLVRERKPFTFVRFSDGEIEVLRNRRLVLAVGLTVFRGRQFSNNFPDFDQKFFDPRRSQDARHDLLASALFRDPFYFKGIPTRHNNALVDREFLLRLNGGFDQRMTFSDLFLNENFVQVRSDFFPFVTESYSDLLVVGNWRCKLNGYLAKGQLLEIPDNFFSTYQQTLGFLMEKLENAPPSALVLSSASSLTNVLGHRLRVSRPDITFLDIGTTLHDLMGLPLGTRAYHKLHNPRSLRERYEAWRYRWHKEYRLEW